MNRAKNTGLVLCGLVLGLSLSAPAAQAVESLKATLSTNRILVDGQEVRLTAYNINGNNYVMLRDIGRAVGFNIYWDSDSKCVQVESDKPYTGEAPVKSTILIQPVRHSKGPLQVPDTLRIQCPGKDGGFRRRKCLCAFRQFL